MAQNYIVHARKLRETQIFYLRGRGQVTNPKSNSAQGSGKPTQHMINFWLSENAI